MTDARPSISEARRQLAKAEEIADSYGWNTYDGVTGPLDNRQFGQFMLQLNHLASAIIESIAQSKPYDGSLNSIRIPVSMLRQLAIDLTKADAEDIGMEDLIVSLRARVNKLDVDK